MISRQHSLLKALLFFWTVPFVCMVVTGIALTMFSDSDPEMPGPAMLGIWFVFWLVVTFLCMLGALPVFLHHPVGEQFQRRLCWIAGLGGVLTCGLLIIGASAMKPGKPSFQWIWVMLGVSVVTMEVLLGVCFSLGWLRAPVKEGFCDNYGYDLRASPRQCPECGQELQNALISADAVSGVR